MGSESLVDPWEKCKSTQKVISGEPALAVTQGTQDSQIKAKGHGDKTEEVQISL